jgi:hypothetical protein
MVPIRVNAWALADGVSALLVKLLQTSHGAVLGFLAAFNEPFSGEKLAETLESRRVTTPSSNSLRYPGTANRL